MLSYCRLSILVIIIIVYKLMKIIELLLKPYKRTQIVASNHDLFSSTLFYVVKILQSDTWKIMKKLAHNTLLNSALA